MGLGFGNRFFWLMTCPWSGLWMSPASTAVAWTLASQSTNWNKIPKQYHGFRFFGAGSLHKRTWDVRLDKKWPVSDKDLREGTKKQQRWCNTSPR